MTAEKIKENLSPEIKTEYMQKVCIAKTNHSLLDKNDEKNLISLAQNGDEKALSILVNYNRRLVFQIAHQYTNRGIDVKDLVSEGGLGFMHAVSKFDLDREEGVVLSTYATLWIKQYIEKYIMDNSRMVRLPVYLIKKITQLTRFRKTFLEENEKEASYEDIENALGFTIEEVQSFDEYNNQTQISNIQKNKSDGNYDLFNEIEDDSSGFDRLEESLTTSRSNELLNCLSEKEKSIIILVYGMYSCEEMSYREIGKIVDLSGERVRQIHKEALSKLQSTAKEKNLSISDFIHIA